MMLGLGFMAILKKALCGCHMANAGVNGLINRLWELWELERELKWQLDLERDEFLEQPVRGCSTHSACKTSARWLHPIGREWAVFRGLQALSSATGPQPVNQAPVSLTSLPARPTSLDSYRMNPQLIGSSASSSSRLSQVRDVAVPQPMGQPKQGWFDMPPVNPSHAYALSGYRPIPGRRNLFMEQPLTRTSSSLSLDSSMTRSSKPGSRPQLTNKQGSFMPQVREDFKLHNRVGNAMRR